jgi:hypothetical protein
LLKIVSDNYEWEDVNTATAFFEMLINDVTYRPVGEDAPALMKRWFNSTDPLQLGQDHECRL